ncbi:MAG: hypothetical protein WBM04_13810, partial [Candidatus Korobacteraceae bacterium]
VTDCSEEVEEDGTIIRRERERFTNESLCCTPPGRPPFYVESLLIDPTHRDGRHAPSWLCSFCTP